MNTYCRRTCLVAQLIFGIGLLAAVEVLAAGVDDEGLAKRIVNTCANVQPSEVVVVAGGKHMLPLMEAVAIETQKSGGFATIFVNTDRLTRSRWVDVPEKFLEQEPHYFGEWLKHIDVWIALPDLEDPLAVIADVPEEKVAKLSKSFQTVLNSLNAADTRVVVVNVPTRQEAEINGLDFASYEKMHWAAVNTDYGKIAEQGNKLKQMLVHSKSVRITSPSGTDVTVSVGDRPVLVWDGVVTPEDAQYKVFLTRVATLPDGTVSFAPIEESTNGRVVVPKHRIRQEPLTGVQFEFKNGKVTNFQADQGGQQFGAMMVAHEGSKDIVASVSIGLNPELKVVEQNGAGFRPIDGAGMVWINTGGNDLMGGKNSATGGFEFPITNATVTVDGTVVVKDGKLQL